MNKKIVLFLLLIAIIILSGCNNKKIQQLEKEKEENNKLVRDVTATYILNKFEADKIADDIKDYLLNIENEDLNFPWYFQNSYLEYNIIVYKSHLLYGIEKAVEDELINTNNNNLTKQDIKQAVIDKVLKSIEFEYFFNPDNGDLEQMIIFTLPDGSQGLFISLWQNSNLIYTNVFMKEVF